MTKAHMTPELRAKLSANLEKARAAKRKRAKAKRPAPSLVTQLHAQAGRLLADARKLRARALALRRAARLVGRG
jgi:hypothetical protein